MTILTKDIQTHWEAVRPILTIHNEHEYDLAVQRLNELLDEIGSQGVVSELLSGKRDLNARQIQALARRFKVSPAVFF